MNTLKQMLPRDSSLDTNDNYFGSSMGTLGFSFFALLMLGSVLSVALICLGRRKRIARERALPMYHQPTHHRSVSMTDVPTFGRNDSVFVFDEKMNLIANSSGPPSASVPEIRITFPDEEHEGRRQSGRVVVVHVTDTGSVGMSPLNQEQLPPYQRGDAERFQSLDLERIGGLREKAPLTGQQRWS